MSFTYLDATGATLPAAAASAPSVRAIQISLTLKPESITGSRQGAGATTMSDRALFRNR